MPEPVLKTVTRTQGNNKALKEGRKPKPGPLVDNNPDDELAALGMGDGAAGVAAQAHTTAASAPPPAANGAAASIPFRHGASGTDWVRLVDWQSSPRLYATAGRNANLGWLVDCPAG